MNVKCKIKNVKGLWLAVFFIFQFSFLIPTSAQAACTCACKTGVAALIGQICSTKQVPDALACNMFCGQSQGCVVDTCTPIDQPAAPTEQERPISAPLPRGVALPNPLGSTNAAIIIGRIARGFMGFTGGIGLLIFIYGGFTWLTAAGNPEKIKKGKDLLLWAVLGILVMFSSYVIVRFILQAITTGVIR